MLTVGVPTLCVRDYESLPDSMPPSELADLFDELLNSPCADTIAVLDALCQLADRQWHTYEPLAPPVHQRVDVWLVDNWLATSLPFTEAATSLVGHLGLPRSWAKIQSLATISTDPNIAAELRGFCAEMEGGDPLDPWSGMPKP